MSGFGAFFKRIRSRIHRCGAVTLFFTPEKDGEGVQKGEGEREAREVGFPKGRGGEGVPKGGEGAPKGGGGGSEGRGGLVFTS